MVGFWFCMAKQLIVDNPEIAARLGRTTTMANFLAEFERALLEMAYHGSDLGPVQPASGLDDTTTIDVLCRLDNGQLVRIEPVERTDAEQNKGELERSYQGAYGSHTMGEYSMDKQGRLLFPKELAETAMRRQRKERVNDVSFYCYLVTERHDGQESRYIHLRDDQLKGLSTDIIAYDRPVFIGDKRRVIIPATFRKSKRNQNGLLEPKKEACYLGVGDHIRIYSLAHMEGIHWTNNI